MKEHIHITGVHVNYYHICQRELWFFVNQINMEHSSDIVAEGRLIEEHSYPQRPESYESIAIGNIQIDFYDAKNKVVHEIKKSDKTESAHIWQVKYYIYVLEQHGIENVTGVLEYPQLRKKQNIVFTDDDRKYLLDLFPKILAILNNPKCPPRIKKKLCTSCSYHDFCWSGEVDEENILSV